MSGLSAFRNILAIAYIAFPNIAPAVPTTILPGDLISINFQLPQPPSLVYNMDSTGFVSVSLPDALSFYLSPDYSSPVYGTSLPGQPLTPTTASLFNGATLLGTVTQNTFNSSSLMGVFISSDAPLSPYFPSTNVNFSSILDGSIMGRIDFSAGNFTFQFDPALPNTTGLFLATNQGLGNGNSADQPIITSVVISSGRTTPTPTCVAPQVLQGNTCVPPTPQNSYTLARQITLPGQQPGTNQIIFDGSKFIVRVDIGLTGGIASTAIRTAWEGGIEGWWNSNRYTLTDESGTYPLAFDVNFLDSGPVDFHVTVKDIPQDTFCRNDSVDWCIYPWVDTVQSNEDMRGAIAAHEFGHLLGIYDEYVGGGTDPNLSMFEKNIDLCKSYPFGIEVGLWCNSLMADYGPLQDRYLKDILAFIDSGLGERNFVLGHNPITEPFLIPDPGPNFNGILEGTVGDLGNSIPEPSSLNLVALTAVLGLLLRRRSSSSLTR